MTGQEAAIRAVRYRDWLLSHAIASPTQMINELCPLGLGNKDILRVFRMSLSTAAIFIWKHEIFRAAVNGCERFDGMGINGQLDSRAELHYFADYFGTDTSIASYFGPEHGYCGFVKTPSYDGQFFLFLPIEPCERQNPEKSGRPVLWFVEGAKENRVSVGGTMYAAMSAFTRQTLVANVQPIHLPRADRRRAKRQNLELPSIRIVQLRQAEPSGWHSSTDREYYHRWLRSGFWRRLPEPLKHDSKVSGGKKGDSLVWVRDTVCGPPGAPLLPSRKTVYAVTR